MCFLFLASVTRYPWITSAQYTLKRFKHLLVYRYTQQVDPSETHDRCIPIGSLVCITYSIVPELKRFKSNLEAAYLWWCKFFNLQWHLMHSIRLCTHLLKRRLGARGGCHGMRRQLVQPQKFGSQAKANQYL